MLSCKEADTSFSCSSEGIGQISSNKPRTSDNGMDFRRGVIHGQPLLPIMVTRSSGDGVPESNEDNGGALGGGSGDIDPRENSASFIQC